MHCPSCKAQASPTSKFCPRCGSGLQPQPSAPRARNWLSPFARVLLMLLFVLAILTTILFALQGSTKESSASSSSLSAKDPDQRPDATPEQAARIAKMSDDDLLG